MNPLFVKPAIVLVNKLLKPHIDFLSSKVNEQFKVAYHDIFNSYSNYLENSYERYSFFTSIIFKNEQKQLEDFYLPLTLKKNSSGKESFEKITKFPEALAEEHQRILIVDTAGMGKSTLLKYLFISCVKEEKGIPIFIELRKLSKKKTILNFISEQLSNVGGSVDQKLLINLLENGKFVIFFDGFDEIAENDKTYVIADIQNFISKAPRNKFFITSREEVGLVAFSDFQRFTIQPLSIEEAYCLLRKYSQDGLAETLIEKLKLPENISVTEFLGNPLLTSLLYKSFEYKAIIPLKKNIFYRQVYEAIFESHDLTKDGGQFYRGKKSNLDIDSFESLMRCLGYLTYKEEKVEFSKDELLILIEKAKKVMSMNKISSSDICNDLTHAVPLMIEDGNYIRWAHKSIQEYFAASFICRDTQGKKLDILLRFYKDGNLQNHFNLITLCADIDPSTYRQSIVKELLLDLLREYESLFIEELPGVSSKEIRQRKRSVVGKKLYFVRMKNASLDSEDPLRINEIGQIIDEIRTLGGFPESLRIIDPSICSASHRLTAAINLVRQKSGYEFIVNKKMFASSDPLLKEIECKAIEISDNKNCILNDHKYFSKINYLILTRSDWEFDSESAKKVLSEILNEITMKDDLLGI